MVMTLEKLAEALEHGKQRDWDKAKRCLAEVDDPLAAYVADFFTHQQERDHLRDRAQAVVRHQLGNLLSIAQANIEGMIDGIVPPTKERLDAIREALKNSSALIDELKRKQ